MGKIAEKHSIADGALVRYVDGTSSGKWFYRKWIKDEKRYVQRLIPNAASLEEARDGLIDVAIALRDEKNSPDNPSVRKPRKKKDECEKRQSVETAIETFLSLEEERADAALISHETAKNRRNLFRNYILPYLHNEKVYYTNKIDLRTFENYLVYRSETTPLQRQQEVKLIKFWCSSYLAKRGLINTALLFDKTFLPKQIVKETDRMKNPAITPEDWKSIIDYVRDDWRHKVKDNYNQRYWFWRNLIWHYLLFSINTGMSPEEVVKMKWKQIEIVDEGRIDSKGERQVWEVAYVSTIRAKTKQPREIPCNQARELRRWREFVMEFCTQHNLPLPNKETPVFGNPFPRSGSPEGWRPYHRTSFSETWRDIRKSIKLNGNRFSPHPYTLYSMRSSFIENHLLKGTPVVEVARMAGHNIVETQRSYERLDLRKKGMEITAPEFGKKQPKKNTTKQLF